MYAVRCVRAVGDKELLDRRAYMHEISIFLTDLHTSINTYIHTYIHTYTHTRIHTLTKTMGWSRRP
jgi:hypothetical protein